MIEKDDIQDLFREKLQSHEVIPSKGVWQGVSSSIANTAVSTGAGAGTSILLKVAVAVVGVSGLSIATYFVVQEEQSIPSQRTSSSIEIENNTASTAKAESTLIQKETQEESNSTEIESNSIANEAVVINEQLAINGQFEEDNLETVNNDPVIEESIAVSNIVIPEEPISSDVEDVIESVNENPIPSELSSNVPSTLESETAVTENEEEIEDLIDLREEEEISLPNIFTPNNDGTNDFFEIAISEKQDFQIVVIDQTNTVIFQSDNVNFRWDGTLPGGEPAPSGNYVYFLSAKTLNGADFVKSSSLRIER